MNSRFVWRVVNAAFVAVVVFSAALLAAVLAGVGDPRPVGRLVWEDEPGVYELEGAEATLMPVLSREFSPSGTLELIARQVGGPGEAAYGLWWGDIRAMVSGSGYMGVWIGDDPIYPWQPFPHVRGPGGQNCIQIVIVDNHLLVRLNDEFVAEGDVDEMATAEVGVIVETFGRGGAVVDFERVRIWEN